MCDYKKIKLIVLDVDGTLTDGGIYYDSNGSEIKRFDVKDGLGIKVGLNAGLKFAVITGRESIMVERRINELGIQYLIQGAQKKMSALNELAKDCDLSMDEIGYIGDDLNDWQVMQKVGFRGCPADAAKQICELSDYIAMAEGGHGAVRECIEYLLVALGKWEEAAKSQYFM